MFREDGYINMTKAAKHFKKDLSNFWKSAENLEYLEELCRAVNSTGLSFKSRYKGNECGCRPVDWNTGYLVTTVTGNRFVTDRGTWCHPKLAVFFARWLDIRFAVWCDLMIDNILQGNIKTSVVVPTDEFRQRIKYKPEYYCVFNVLR